MDKAGINALVETERLTMLDATAIRQLATIQRIGIHSTMSQREAGIIRTATCACKIQRRPADNNDMKQTCFHFCSFNEESKPGFPGKVFPETPERATPR
jgi:hypothetical protein